MITESKSRNAGPFIWLAAAILIGVLVAINPFYQPDVNLRLGIAAWVVDLALVLAFATHPLTARAGMLLAGLFLAVPCFLREAALLRFFLMLCMVVPLALAAAALLAPPTFTYRERLGHVFTWFGTRKVKRRPRCFAMRALLHLIAATLVLVAAAAVVKAVSAAGLWLTVRWLAGGIIMLAVAEMLTAGHEFLTALAGVTAPALMQSPFLSKSVAEFWTRRWNVPASVLLFRPFFLAVKSPCGAAAGLWTAFAVSAVAHLMMFYMATGRWFVSMAFGAFFLLQPLLILAERRLKVRRWHPATARMWTLTGLAITSPLFVEPELQILEPGRGAPDELLVPILATLAFVLSVNALLAFGSLLSRPEPHLNTAVVAQVSKPAVSPISKSANAS